MRTSKPEILSPAGDWIGLRAALDAGCDAVYFGVKGLNMRAGAENFTAASLPKIARLCHEADARAYLALNTIVYEKELGLIQKLLGKAGAAGVDAVICWDVAVLQAARRAGIPVHVSTQMSVANTESMLFFIKHFDIRRFVLARECSLVDIRKIRRQLKNVLGQKAASIELEVFAHGAMCVSVSGRCFMSQFHYGTSANRGECYQPCRREYTVTALDEDISFTLGTNYIMSPKDLCTLPFIEKLIEAGVAGLKIEGRNRSPEYVGTVTDAYRQAVDFYTANKGRRGFQEQFEQFKKNLMHNLDRVYHRGFSSGFFLGKPIDEWTDGPGSRAAVRKEYVGIVTKHYKKAGVAEIKVESNEFRQGDEIMFQGPTTGTFTQGVASIEINHEKIDTARKGSLVAVKVDQVTRKNDKVYVVKANS